MFHVRKPHELEGDAYIPPYCAGGADRGDVERESGVKTRPRVQRPQRWRVLLHNDDYTTMNFVIEVLVQFFAKSMAEATHVMLQVHTKGVGVAGVYPRDVAETKVSEVTRAARKREMPLMLTIEPE